MLRHRPLDALLEAFSSSDPTPGGGSAAALAGAVGASLLAMVAGLPKTRQGLADDRATLDAARSALLSLRDTLAELVDRDTEAYDRVVSAFRLPRSTDEEKAARTAAVQTAFKGATEVPLAVMRACAAAMTHADTVAARGNPSASSDVLVGIELTAVGVRSARYNVEINLAALKDAEFVGRVKADADRVARDAESVAATARARLA